MSAWLLEHEPVVRLSAFFGLFLVMGLWELAAPVRQLRLSKLRRWGANLGLVVVNNLVVRLLFPAAAVGVAMWASEAGWGLFPRLGLSGLPALGLGIVVLDFAIYLQHRVSHAVPWLWRLHRVHHTDLDFDVTTAIRFHPAEIVLSMLYKLALVAILGVPPVAVLLFEVILNATAMFNHGNVALPRAVDAVVRWFVVTPDMHRVHHSVVPRETHSNFGFNLPIWDRLLGTYVEEPTRPLVIGVPEEQRTEVQTVPWMIALPFRAQSKLGRVDREVPELESPVA